MTPSPASPVRPENRLNLDYRAEARRLGPPPAPITDIHSHINGERAAAIYRDARSLYGVSLTFSMTQLAQAEPVKRVLGDSIQFIAVPDYMSSDLKHAMTQGFIDNITEWHKLGSRICKFWTAPRGRDFGEKAGDRMMLTFESPWRRKQMDHAASLGMMFMVHVADPDTWFATTYRDASKYGTKLQQYEPLERHIDEYKHPWILAHMGGWPEDLDFLSGLLSRHSNTYLDTSATKWMVRELSKHPTQKLLAFLNRWRGRILFGSDIVTMDSHLTADNGPNERGAQSASPEEAFDLYASRYFALRTLFETSYEGESPIADPDLKLVDPAAFDDFSAPPLKGHNIPRDLLRTIYCDAATQLLKP